MPGEIIVEEPEPLDYSTFQDPEIWEWIAGITEAPDEDIFTTSSSNAEIHGYLKDPSLLQSALVFFLGYAYVDSSFQLRRYLPNYHPRWNWLYCARVSVKGVKSTGQDEPISLDYLDSLPCPTYERYRFTMHYEGLPYQVRGDQATDDSGKGEWFRFLTIEPTDETETYLRETIPLKFVAPGKGFDKVDVLNTGQVIRSQRAGLVVTAHGIPGDFIMDDYGIPTKLIDAKGRTNSTTFLDRPAGTMLLENYEIEKTPQPIATQDGGFLSFGCKVKMHFGYTNPTPEIVGETHRGWNLVPSPVSPGNTVGWYYATSNGEAGGTPIYESKDMNALLTHRDLNDL